MEESLEDLISRIINSPSKNVPITVNELERLKSDKQLAYDIGRNSYILVYNCSGGACKYKRLVSTNTVA